MVDPAEWMEFLFFAQHWARDSARQSRAQCCAREFCCKILFFARVRASPLNNACAREFSYNSFFQLLPFPIFIRLVSRAERRSGDAVLADNARALVDGLVALNGLQGNHVSMCYNCTFSRTPQPATRTSRQTRSLIRHSWAAVRLGAAARAHRTLTFHPSITLFLITSLAQPLRPLRHRRSVTFVEGVRLIGDEAFRGSQLTEVTLPPSLERVGRYAFAFSRVATTTFVPGASGAYVGAYAFRQCPVARTSVSVLASMPPSIAGRFSRLAFYYEDGRRRSRAAGGAAK